MRKNIDLRTCRRMSKTVENDLVRIGKRLKEIRVAKGYTSYRQFADSFEFEPKNIWRLEEGKSDFKYSSLKKVTEALGLSVEEFFRGL